MSYVAWSSYIAMMAPGEESCLQQIKSSAFCACFLLLLLVFFFSLGAFSL